MTAEALLIVLRSRGIIVASDGTDLLCTPADALTAADLATIRQLKPALLAIVAELAAFEADGTGPLWRAAHEGLSSDHRERFAGEVASGDPIAVRLWLSLDAPELPGGRAPRGGFCG